MAENIDIFDFELTEEEVAAINAIPERPIFVHPEEWPSFIPTMDNPFDYSQQQ